MYSVDVVHCNNERESNRIFVTKTSSMVVGVRRVVGASTHCFNSTNPGVNYEPFVTASKYHTQLATFKYLK